MVVAIVVALVARAGPGPLDAFRANYASLRVELEYSYVAGFMDASNVTSGRLWTEHGLGLAETADSKVSGRWATDGVVEYYSFSSPEDQIEKAKAAPREVIEDKYGKLLRRRYVPKTEALWDGKTLAGHVMGENPTDDSTIRVWATGDAGYLTFGKGPFFWWGPDPFPRYLDTAFPGVAPSHRVSTRGGHRVEVETYEIPEKPGLGRLEVAYDPAVGYLPRYLRLLVPGQDGKARFREMYLVEARMCGSGGFIPIEWYETHFMVDKLATAYPADTGETILEPKLKVHAGHFVATKVSDRTAPIAFTNLRNVKSVAAIGGVQRLANRGALGMNDIKAIMGRRITEAAAPALPGLDADELHKFDARPGRGWYWYLAGIGLVLLIGFILSRRYVAPVALLTVVPLGGCGHVGEPVIKLTASFKQPRILVEKRAQQYIPMDLVVRNDGNLDLKFFGADGGCSCRRVDKSVFPITLKPGESRSLRIDAQDSGTSQPQNASFAFETNNGTIQASVPYHIMHQFQLDPDSPSHTSLQDDGGWEFELVRRVLYKSEGRKPTSKHLDPVSL